MPLNEKVFDDQTRFVFQGDLKRRLYREAARRHMSAADLLRLFIEEGLARGHALVRIEGGRGASKQASKASKTGAVLQKRNLRGGA